MNQPHRYAMRVGSKTVVLPTTPGLHTIDLTQIPEGATFDAQPPNPLAAELRAIADKLALLFTVRLDDPINTWHPDSRDAWQKENLAQTIARIRAVADRLEG